MGVGHFVEVGRASQVAAAAVDALREYSYSVSA